MVVVAFAVVVVRLVMATYSVEDGGGGVVVAMAMAANLCTSVSPHLPTHGIHVLSQFPQPVTHAGVLAQASRMLTCRLGPTRDGPHAGQLTCVRGLGA